MEIQNNKRSKTVAFDFDGVIAKYEGFVSVNDVKEPVSEVIEAIKVLREKGYKVLIYSTRGDEFLKKYCQDFDIEVDYINRRLDKEGENSGKPVAFVYVEDRAICYKGQKSEQLVSEIENFKAYWEEK